MAGVPLAALHNTVKELQSIAQETEVEAARERLSSLQDSPAGRRSSFSTPDRINSFIDRRKSFFTKKNSGLVNDVLDCITMLDEEDMTNDLETEEAEEEFKQMYRKMSSLAMEGYLEKKGVAAHSIWKKRYFKLITREGPHGAGLIHNLMWFLKKDDPVIKSIDLSHIGSMMLLQSSRPLSYATDERRLLLTSEAAKGDPTVHEWSDGKETSFLGLTVKQFSFQFNMNNDQDIYLLRASKVDKIIRWMNIIALVRSRVCLFICLFALV